MQAYTAKNQIAFFSLFLAGTVDGARTRTTLIESQRELPIILLRHINASYTQTLANA